jgi:hypothetical protein
MKRILCLLMMFCAVNAFGQKTKEDKKEEQEEKKLAGKDRVDIAVFRRQILSMPEFSEQRRRVAEWRAQGKGIIKIFAVVDSLNEYEDGKFMKGFIQLIKGDEVANVYELTFDRGLKRITLVKPTSEKLDLGDDEEKAERKPKTTAKPVKKKKTGDDEDDEEEEADEDEDEEPQPKTTRKKRKDDDD